MAEYLKFSDISISPWIYLFITKKMKCLPQPCVEVCFTSTINRHHAQCNEPFFSNEEKSPGTKYIILFIKNTTLHCNSGSATHLSSVAKKKRYTIPAILLLFPIQCAHTNIYYLCLCTDSSFLLPPQTEGWNKFTISLIPHPYHKTNLFYGYKFKTLLLRMQTFSLLLLKCRIWTINLHYHDHHLRKKIK